jgi:hypothetical protein
MVAMSELTGASDPLEVDSHTQFTSLAVMTGYLSFVVTVTLRVTAQDASARAEQTGPPTIPTVVVTAHSRGI